MQRPAGTNTVNARSRKPLRWVRGGVVLPGNGAALEVVPFAVELSWWRSGERLREGRGRLVVVVGSGGWVSPGRCFAPGVAGPGELGEVR